MAGLRALCLFTVSPRAHSSKVEKQCLVVKPGGVISPQQFTVHSPHFPLALPPSLGALIWVLMAAEYGGSELALHPECTSGPTAYCCETSTHQMTFLSFPFLCHPVAVPPYEGC